MDSGTKFFPKLVPGGPEQSICMRCFLSVVPKKGQSLSEAEEQHRCDSVTIVDCASSPTSLSTSTTWAMFLTGSSVRTSRGCGTRYVASVTGASTSRRSSRRHKGQNPVRTKPSSERIPDQVIAAAEQTKARGHLDRACGNSVPPKTRPAGFQDLTLSPSDMCRTHPHP
jgi:hypothetical protein